MNHPANVMHHCKVTMQAQFDAISHHEVAGIETNTRMRHADWKMFMLVHGRQTDGLVHTIMVNTKFRQQTRNSTRSQCENFTRICDMGCPRTFKALGICYLGSMPMRILRKNRQLQSVISKRGLLKLGTIKVPPDDGLVRSPELTGLPQTVFFQLPFRTLSKPVVGRFLFCCQLGC
jgi:hypothetical protein